MLNCMVIFGINAWPRNFFPYCQLNSGAEMVTEVFRMDWEGLSLKEYNMDQKEQVYLVTHPD